jgi:hypothetical protein
MNETDSVDDQYYLLTFPQNYHGSPNYTLWQDPLNCTLPEKKFQLKKTTF